MPEVFGLHLDEIQGFLVGVLGPHASVLHELVSDVVHIDVLVFRPNDTRNVWTLVTSGMSDLPMHVPTGLSPKSDFERAELVVTLPATWFTADESGDLSEQDLDLPEKFWPIAVTKSIALLPHKYRSWVWMGHTVALANPPQQFHSSTKLSAAILLPLTRWPMEKQSLVTKDGVRITFLSVVPLHANEMDYALNKGDDALLSLLDDAGVTELVDPDRSSVIPKRRFLGIF